MASCSYSLLAIRSLRRNSKLTTRSPFWIKQKKGLDTRGPVHFAEWAWPSGDPHNVAQQFSPNQHSVNYGANEFSNLSPKIKLDKPWNSTEKTYNLPALRNYTGVQPSGYTDPDTQEYVHVKEMQPELVVPDLKGFQLKPYVSFRTDVDEDKRRLELEKRLDKCGGELDDDFYWTEYETEEIYWPPPKITAKQLFNWHYRPKIEEDFKSGLYGEEVDKIKRQIDKTEQEDVLEIKEK